MSKECKLSNGAYSQTVFQLSATCIWTKILNLKNILFNKWIALDSRTYLYISSQKNIKQNDLSGNCSSAPLFILFPPQCKLVFIANPPQWIYLYFSINKCCLRASVTRKCAVLLHIPLALRTDESQMQTEVLQIQTHIISYPKIKMLYMYNVKGVQTFQWCLFTKSISTVSYMYLNKNI
jgi:hypothetical protein